MLLTVRKFYASSTSRSLAQSSRSSGKVGQLASAGNNKSGLIRSSKAVQNSRGAVSSPPQPVFGCGAGQWRSAASACRSGHRAAAQSGRQASAGHGALEDRPDFDPLRARSDLQQLLAKVQADFSK